MSEQPKTLFDVLIDLWHAKRFLLTGIVAGLVIATVFVVTAVPHHKAHMLISPANPMNGAEASSLLGDDNLFALRYLAQRVGVANSTNFLRFENTYTGTSVAEALLKEPKIKAGLDLDRGFSFSLAKTAWDAEELAAYIDQRVRIEPVGATSLRRMVYLHPNKEFGKYFLQTLHKTTDELIRKKLYEGANARVEYLNRTIRSTNNPEHRRALTSLLLEQERQRMLVSIELPYAAAIIEPPSASAKTAWPSASLIFVGFALVGALLGFVVHGLRLAVQGDGRYFPSKQQWEAWFRPTSRNNNERPLTGKTQKTKRRAQG